MGRMNEHSKRWPTPVCKHCWKPATVTMRGYCDRDECKDLALYERYRELRNNSPKAS